MALALQGQYVAPTEVADILEAASSGDDRAWSELVERYARRVFALARSRCRDAELAEEITQSVFVTVAEKLGKGEYQEQGKFEAWLFRVTMNRVRDEIRRANRQAIPVAPEILNGRARADASGDGDALEALRRAMASLSDPDRDIIELRHHGQLSFRQIADLLDEPLGTLLARHHRALKKLKDLLQAGGIDHD
ncbi:MAG: sigma-70 family RNA polymerase sigma factor [Phycisphaerales bacterium]|nr:sigma-70 family RNA polymerase sigma factor [Phycisphaerales bacterium]